MADLTVHEMLKQEIEMLPEELAEEVFDFLLFVKARHAEEDFLWRQAEEARAHRREHPDEVSTASAEEWEQTTARWRSEG